MKLNKRVSESILIASLGLLLTFTTFAGSTDDEVSTTSVVQNKNGKAGIIVELNYMEQNAVSTGMTEVASIEKMSTNLVASSAEGSQSITAVETTAVLSETEINSEAVAADQTEAVETAESTESAPRETTESVTEQTSEMEQTVTTEQTTEETVQTEQPSVTEPVVEAEQPTNTEQTVNEAQNSQQSAVEAEWAARVMPNVEEDMNIRALPDENSEIVGKFYRGDAGTIISVSGDWTQITSGNVTGYVKNEYIVTGMDAFNLASQVCTIYATVSADALRLRSTPSEDAEIVTQAANGEKLTVNKDAEAVPGWVAVSRNGSSGYVSEEFVTVAFNLGTALTAEEVAAKEAEEAAKKAEQAGDVRMLGAIIQCEAGNSSYEGMLAVGAVVMNRVKSGRYPGSIKGVIYQGGQFSPVASGHFESVLNNGVKSSCLQAAQAAIDGADNTGGALSFRSASSGAAGVNIGGNVFF